jgi:hypothetical protein
MLKPGINDLFPTPVMLGKIDDDIRQQVADEILSDQVLINTRAADDNDILFAVGNEIVDRFRDTVAIPALDDYLQKSLGLGLRDFSGYKVKAWVTNFNNFQSLNLHNHRGSYLSSVFYLMAENKDQGGEISFVDPRSNANRGYNTRFGQWFDNVNFMPSTGDYIVFPSFLYHYVQLYAGINRLTVVVDLFLYDED